MQVPSQPGGFKLSTPRLTRRDDSDILGRAAGSGRGSSSQYTVTVQLPVQWRTSIDLLRPPAGSGRWRPSHESVTRAAPGPGLGGQRIFA